MWTYKCIAALSALWCAHASLRGAAASNTTDLEPHRQLGIDTDILKSMFYDQYRVNIDMLPLKYEVPGNVSWSELKNPKKFTASAAYDLYKAVYQDQDVVVKILRDKSKKESRKGAPKEMEKEIKVLSRLVHPNIIRLLGHGYQPYRFMILEYLGGGTLSRKLNYTYRDNKNYGKFKLPQAKAFEYGIKIADALAYAHEDFHPSVRLFHRDLKSDNIAFTTSGEIKVFDFGLCELIRKAKQEDAVFHLGHGVGSWRYTAPEVRNHNYYNHKSDVYGFAIIFYHLLVGRHPISNSWNKTHTYQRVVDEGWRPPLKQEWPNRLNRLLARAWNYDIKARPNMVEVVKELKSINEEYPDIEKAHTGGFKHKGTLYVM